MSRRQKIDPEKSKATLMGTKLEISLAKAAEGEAWADLEADTGGEEQAPADDQ